MGELFVATLPPLLVLPTAPSPSWVCSMRSSASTPAELDLVQAKNDYLLGRVRLASAAGELREDDLRALNGYLVR